MNPEPSDRLGQREGEKRSGQRNDLEPRLVDEAPAAGVDDDRGGSCARDDATQHAVADLLGHELGGVAVSDRSFLRQRDGERDEEERHADPVVEATLDVEALTDSDGETTRRDDDLTERGIRRGEDDREHESFGPREVSEERDCGDEPGDDREREPDPQQPRGHTKRASKCLQVDARRIGEEDDRECRFGERLDLEPGRCGIDEVERLHTDDEAGCHEEHGRGDPGPLDPS